MEVWVIEEKIDKHWKPCINNNQGNEDFRMAVFDSHSDASLYLKDFFEPENEENFRIAKKKLI